MKPAFINEFINGPTVVLIDQNGDNLGKTPKYVALEKAKTSGLDLIQISSDAEKVPVCKIDDYEKMRYQESKKKSLKSKNSHKEKHFYIHLNTADHDVSIKKDRMKYLLAKGYRLKFGIELRGRENNQSAAAKEKLGDYVRDFDAIAQKDDIVVSGRMISIMLYPIRK